MSEKIWQEVKDEMYKQDARWGEQNHQRPFWLAILMEEVGEVAKAVIEYDSAAYREELIQVAAVAISALESLERQDHVRKSDHN